MFTLYCEHALRDRAEATTFLLSDTQAGTPSRVSRRHMSETIRPDARQVCPPNERTRTYEQFFAAFPRFPHRHSARNQHPEST